MIYELSQAVEIDLRARKFPIVVEYGPRVVDPESFPDGVIVIERDDTPDAVGPAVGAQSNPRKYRTRTLGGKATVYARSNVDGASVGEHEAVCEALVDALLVSLIECVSAAKGGPDVPIAEARYLRRDERPEVEVWPGRVYLLRFRVLRAVLKRDGQGAARPTGAATSIQNRTDVRLRGGDPEADPETGCDST